MFGMSMGSFCKRVHISEGLWHVVPLELGVALPTDIGNTLFLHTKIGLALLPSPKSDRDTSNLLNINSICSQAWSSYKKAPTQCVLHWKSRSLAYVTICAILLSEHLEPAYKKINKRTMIEAYIKTRKNVKDLPEGCPSSDKKAGYYLTPIFVFSGPHKETCIGESCSL